MSVKILSLFAIISFCCQIIFSIYYSTTIVDQNFLINTQRSNLDQLNINNEQLKIKLSSLNSLMTTEEFTKNKKYSPITSSVDLINNAQ